MAKEQLTDLSISSVEPLDFLTQPSSIFLNPNSLLFQPAPPSGDDSINYLLFAHQDNIHHVMCDADPVGNLLQFRKLQVLQCNRVGHHSLDAVLKIAESSDLVMLCCNLDNHDSTSVQLNPDLLRPLQVLHDRLRESSILRNRWSREGFPT